MIVALCEKIVVRINTLNYTFQSHLIVDAQRWPAAIAIAPTIAAWSTTTKGEGDRGELGPGGCRFFYKCALKGT